MNTEIQEQEKEQTEQEWNEEYHHWSLPPFTHSLCGIEFVEGRDRYITTPELPICPICDAL